MISNLNFFKQYTKINENVLPKDYHISVVMHYAAIAGFFVHALLIPTFYLLGIYELALFNVVSILAYFLCFKLNYYGKYDRTLSLGIVEVVVHAYLAVAFLGWDSGFHYYILCLVPLVFFFPINSSSFKIVVTILLSLVYIFLRIFSYNREAITPLTHITLETINSANIVCTIIIFSIMSHFYSVAAKKAEGMLKEANTQLDILAQTDPLTNLLNRRSMLDKIHHEFKRFEIYDKPFTMILCDVDNFKHFNDTYGHDCGDKVLVSVAKVLRGNLRRDDYIARWGGEEFLIVLPETDLTAGFKVAEKVRDKISGTVFKYNDLELSLTITCGVSICTQAEDVTTCLINADKALHAGKLQGKDRTVTSAAV